MFMQTQIRFDKMPRTLHVSFDPTREFPPRPDDRGINDT